MSDSLSEPVAPGHEETPYWEFFSRMLDSGDERAFDEIDALLDELEGER
jgi:hypothetical protein